MAKVVKSSLANLGLCLAIFLPISFPIGPSAQSSSHPSKAASRSETPTPKLTPEQERGLRLLNGVVGESAGLQPNMHAFVLWQASYAYTELDPKHAEKLSRDVFMATQTIEDAPESDRCGAPGTAGDIKSWIQQRVLYDMVRRDQLKEIKQLLPQATPTVRNEITAELVRYYESKKDLIHAETLLSTLADSDRYPFGVAANLVAAFGPESSADRMNIFNQALNNFERHSAQTSVGGDDIGTFIERTWKDVPPGVALEAIDKVLDTTKDNDSQSHYSMSSAKGSVVLNSAYALRLFQLLPILEQLDSAKAEGLLREQTDVAEQLKPYPGGMQSLQSQSTTLSYGGIAAGGSGLRNAAAEQQISAQMQDRVEDILAKADTDPAGALAAALTLPVHGTSESSSPRSDALLGIAEKSAAKQLSVSKSALDELSTIQDELTSQEMIGIDRLPALYLKMGDVDAAKKAVEILVKAAGKVYEHDTDTTDPNKAFKGAWPSTDLWTKAIREGAKISPMLPEEIIYGLPDPEIAAFEKVAFASALIGRATIDTPISVADCRKHGASFRTSSAR
jgi:hypothetical protein